MTDEYLTCPNCGSKKAQQHGIKMKCDRCFYEGEYRPHTPKQIATSPPGVVRKPTPATPPSAPALASTNGSGTTTTLVEGVFKIVDTYDKDGERRTVEQYFRPSPEKYIPDLELSEKQANVQMWKHKAQFKRDRRYGRDWLKKNGYVCVGQVEQNGKMVDKWEKESERR